MFRISKPPVERNVYSFKKANFTVIIQLLSCIYWGNFNDFNNVNDAFTYFYDIVLSVIKDNVPLVKIKTHRYPVWYYGILTI